MFINSTSYNQYNKLNSPLSFGNSHFITIILLYSVFWLYINKPIPKTYIVEFSTILFKWKKRKWGEREGWIKETSKLESVYEFYGVTHLKVYMAKSKRGYLKMCLISIYEFYYWDDINLTNMHVNSDHVDFE